MLLSILDKQESNSIDNSVVAEEFIEKVCEFILKMLSEKKKRLV